MLEKVNEWTRQLGACLVVAFAVRLLFLLVLFPLVERAVGANYAATNYDADGYGAIADKILEGKSMGLERAPVYPFFLAVIYSFSGHSHVAVEIAQAGLDTATVGLLWAMARRVTTHGYRWRWAGWLYALYPLAWWRCAFINKEIFETFALAIFVWAFLEALQPLQIGEDEWGRKKSSFLSLWRMFGCGMALGLANLVKPIFLLFPLALAFWFWREQKVIGHVWTSFLILCLGMVITILPWSHRNYRLSGAIIPVATERGGVTLFVGNYYPSRGAWEGVTKPLWQKEEQRIAKEHSTATPLELDSVFFRAALGNIVAHPLEFAEMFALKGWRFWFENASLRLRKLVLVVQILFVGLGVVGLFRQSLDPSHKRLFGLLIGYVWLLHAVIYADVRFSLPVIPYVILLGLAGAKRGKDAR